MSDFENRGYDLDNFDDKKLSGRHFKGENEEFTELLPSDDALSDENDTVSDYGDDFYSTSDTFEPNDEQEDDYPAPVIKKEQYSSRSDKPDSSKKKNLAIIILSVTLALVIFVFALVVFLNSDKNDNKKETTSSTVASETQEETQEETQPSTEEETQAVTEETQAMTDAPTEAPTEAVTEEVTQEPTQAPTEEETYDDPTQSEDGVFYL
ncbi:MAG: hypothetical protein IJO20_04810 [Ruminococcus sp.]|nr:hypothetical protein [Ruminococcus sp.]